MTNKAALPTAHFGSFGADGRGWDVSLISPRAVHVARRLDEVIPLLREAERESRTSWVALAVSYDAAPAFDECCVAREPGTFPLAWAAVFDSPSIAREPAPDEPFAISPWRPLVSPREYAESVALIRNRIEKGDTYQVNYTFPLEAEFTGDPWTCYKEFGKRQLAGYSAYLAIADHTVLSFSPELFIERTGDTLITRPMKGTARRGRWLREDAARAEQLRTSVKDRAENVMIVDLLRNDLSRVARLGTVKVPELFKVEPYGRVLQMSSTVVGEVDPDQGLVPIMRALFPCGSITGTPKYSSMSIIREIEPSPRGLYTGTIGYLRPGGDFILNVAIRTMVINNRTGRATFGVGGAIMWDSTVHGEYDEALLKAAFLSEPDESFDLLETIGLIDGRYQFLEAHLTRAEESARYYRFVWNGPEARAELDRIASLHRVGSWKVRATFSQSGTVTAAAQELASTIRAQKVRFAASPIDREDPFLFNKTTNRRAYEERLAQAPEADDVILWNEDGEVTESSIANIVVELDGQLYTPPRASGLLAGVLREELLHRGIVRERVITKNELAEAGSFFLVNSVRGWSRADLIDH